MNPMAAKAGGTAISRQACCWLPTTIRSGKTMERGRKIVNHRCFPSKHMLLTLGFATLFLGACQSAPDKFVHRNFSLIRAQHSTQGDVIALIGEPSHQLGDLWMYERPEKHLFAKIEFDENGNVVEKDWIDGVKGEWEDSDETPTDPVQ